MKKLIFSALLILISVSTINATNNLETKTTTNSEAVISYSELSTLCKLIREGNYESVKALLNNGTNINRKSMGMTPVMFAARYNKVKILKLLIEKGANLTKKSDRGHTAMDYAKMSKATEALEILKAAIEK